MSLTDMQIKRLEAKEKAYKVADSAGLFIRVFPSGMVLNQRKHGNFVIFLT